MITNTKFNKGISTIAAIIVLVVAIAAGILIGTSVKKAPVSEEEPTLAPLGEDMIGEIADESIVGEVPETEMVCCKTWPIVPNPTYSYNLKLTDQCHPQVDKYGVPAMGVGYEIVSDSYCEQQAEESEQVSVQKETFVNQPGDVKSITSIGAGQWVLAVDLLTHNPNFIPGVNDFFINQNPKIRNLNVTNTTNTYLCGAGPDGNETTADVLQNTSSFIQDLQQRDYSVYYFDIDGTDITAIYQQCLP